VEVGGRKGCCLPLVVCKMWCLPRFWYSSMVFFSPTLKPSVCSGSRSSGLGTAPTPDMIAVVYCYVWQEQFLPESC